MTDPKRRYQRWLRVYPKEYRSLRGDEILATLLDSTDHDHPKIMDLFHIVVHTIRVRLSSISKGPVKRPLPQPVRLLTWILVGLAVVNWANAILNAALGQSHPKEPSMQPRVIVTGFVLLGLNLLLQAAASAPLYNRDRNPCGIHSDRSDDNRTLWRRIRHRGACLVFVLLLAAGWRRYMATISSKETPAAVSKGTRLV